MKLQARREYLCDLVLEKYRRSRSLTDEEKALGFLGWHERVYLPHCDFPGLVQFVTFRLADSLPESRRGEWEQLLKIEDDREKGTKLEEYLDREMGECHLRDVRIAKPMEEELLFFHHQRYELLAWCVMPNHVHVWQTPLSKIVQSWKRYVATHAEAHQSERRPPTRRVSENDTNAPARRAALRWQREYWDTFMCNETQEKTAIRYIENNPVKARLSTKKEQWPFSSARFRDEFTRLAAPLGTPVSGMAC